MNTIVFRNQEKVSTQEVLERFNQSLNDCEVFSEEEAQRLAEVYAKNPVDKFVISQKPTDLVAQGDIIFWAEGTPMYEKHRPLVKNIKKTERLVLQEGDSITGDHRVVPIEGSKLTLETGNFAIPALRDKSPWNAKPEWKCILIDSDKPFLVYHREHGNIVLPCGKYMALTALDPASSSFSRMMD